MPDDVDPDDRVASYDTYDDRTMVSTSWTYEPLIIKTPAFAGGSEMTFSGANLGEAYDKLLAVNPNWNCTIVGGCPENGGLKKRDHAQVVSTKCGGFAAGYYGDLDAMVQRLHNKGNMQVCAPAGPGRCARIACNKKINDYSAAAIGYCNDNNYPVCAYATNMGDNARFLQSKCQGTPLWSGQQFYVNKRNIIFQKVSNKC